MTQVPDNELVRQAQAGDYEAFAVLVSRYERSLYATAWRLVHNHDDAQDVVQNAFLATMEHLASFRREASFSTWITRIAINLALKVLRGRRQHPVATLDAPDDDGPAAPAPQYIADWRHDPARAVERGELETILTDAIWRLPEGQRLVFVLRDVQGLSVQETSQALNLTEGNVKVRLLRARLALQEMLTRKFGDPATRQRPHDHGPATGRPMAAALPKPTDQEETA